MNYKIASYIVGGIAAVGGAILAFKPIACRISSSLYKDQYKDLEDDILIIDDIDDDK